MIEYYKKTISQPELKKVDEFKVGCWINVTAPNHEELKRLSKTHKLDIELLEEGLDDNELPRIDFDDENTYVYVKSGHKDKNKLLTILIVIGKDFILSLSKHKVSEFDYIINQKVKIVTTQRLKTLISMLYLIDEGIEKDVLMVVKTVQQKKKTSRDLKEEDIDNLLDFEDYLNNLVSMYYYTSLLYSKLTKHLNFFEDDKLMLQDLIVETEEGLNLCKNSLKTISNIRNNYSIVLTHKLNRSIQILTIFTIVLSIPTAIVGFYGMNIKLPFQYSPFAFLYIILIIIFFIMMFFRYARKNQLL